MMKTDRERSSTERHRELHEMMDRILETEYAELLAGVLEWLYAQEMSKSHRPDTLNPPASDKE